MKRFKNILYVAQNIEACKPSLERAVTLAENNQARLTVVDVVDTSIEMPEDNSLPTELRSALLKTHAEQLENLVSPYLTRIGIETKVLTGTPFLEIIREVLHNQFDLVIKNPETLSWMDHLYGSDDMHLLRKCPCPVWLIKPGVITSYRRILATVDVDDAYPPAKLTSQRALNQQILEMAVSLALSDSAELHIMHAWESTGESAMRGVFMNTPEEEIIAYVEKVRQKHAAGMDTLLHELTSKFGNDTLDYVKPQTHLVKGLARKEIPAFARQIEADVIIMGTVARTGVPGFIIGNTAETILNQIDCSVLAIKPPDFQTPVSPEG